MDPIVAYLAQLRRLLRGAPRANTRLLQEVEAHLRDAAAAAAAQGLSAEDAADVALARVGPAARIAEAAAAHLPVPSLAVRLAVHALRLGALVLVVLGLNGLLGEPLARLWGVDFFFGDERSVPVSAERCAQLLRMQPGQSSCNAALVEHHFGEYVEYGLVAAVLGALLLWAVRAWRDRFEPVGNQRALLDLAAALAAVVQFALLAASRLPQGVLGALRNPSQGAGRALTEGVACALATAVFASLAVRQARAQHHFD